MSRQGIYALLAVVIGLTVAISPVDFFPRWVAVVGMIAAVVFVTLSYLPKGQD